MPRVLFISGSLGLGHVTRDLAIARALRARLQRVEIEWLAGEPARSVLRSAGEPLHARCEEYASDTEPAEAAAAGGSMNILRYLFKARGAWAANARLFGEIVRTARFDAVVGDEAYEIGVALMRNQVTLDAPYVGILDFVGLDAMTRSPVERLAVRFWNSLWARDHEVYARGRNVALFVGEIEDVLDKPFGWRLPNRREYARRYYRFLGYVLSFDPADLRDRRRIRAELGFGAEPLVVVSIGGTAVGRDLLIACGQAYALAKQRIPDLRMVLVCGPRVSPASLALPPGPEVKGYVPDLPRLLAASDLAIVQGGGTTTLELTALGRPFIYVPVEGQSEQEIMVAGRLARHGAGIRLSRADASPQRIADLVRANIGTQPTYASLRTDGASTAAALIAEAVSDARGSGPAAG
jgi:UDP:flavonoid glycosyltransferase YjiC (YdhE family)